MNIDDIPLPIQHRLRTIEICLIHYGYVNRDMLSILFGIGNAQVSKDIATYRGLSNCGVFYNHATRKIERRDSFKKVFRT